MAKTPIGANALEQARDAIFRAVHKAEGLADATDRLEALYAHEPGELNHQYFGAYTTDNTGRELWPDWKDHAPVRERRTRRQAIDAVLALREAVDQAIVAVGRCAAFMDSQAESADRRWTMRTISDLRILRGAINRGHPPNAGPSALPMVRAGVPSALREHAATLRTKAEDLKSAILAGVQPQPTSMNERPKRKKRKRPLVNYERPLTTLEMKTLEVVGRHQQNFAAAAHELKRNPKTVKENYDRALAKSSRMAGKKSRSVKAGQIPMDRRGNANF